MFLCLLLSIYQKGNTMMQEVATPRLELWIEGICVGHIFEVLKKPSYLYWTVDLVEPYSESVQPLFAWYVMNDRRTIQVKTGDTTKEIQAYLISANMDYFRPIVEIELGLQR